MSNTAIVGYIRGLIDAQDGLTIKKVLDTVGVSENYLSRVETGDTTDPSARILNALVLAVRGNLTEATELLNNDNATALDGRMYAVDRAIDLGLISRDQRDAFLNAGDARLRRSAARLRRKGSHKS